MQRRMLVECKISQRISLCLGFIVEEQRLTHMPIPTTQYVAYQKLTLPAYGPPFGGHHGIARTNTWMARKKRTTKSQARNSERLMPERWRRRLRTKTPKVMAKLKIALG